VSDKELEGFLENDTLQYLNPCLISDASRNNSLTLPSPSPSMKCYAGAVVYAFFRLELQNQQGRARGKNSSEALEDLKLRITSL